MIFVTSSFGFGGCLFSGWMKVCFQVKPNECGLLNVLNMYFPNSYCNFLEFRELGLSYYKFLLWVCTNFCKVLQCSIVYLSISQDCGAVTQI